MYFSSTLLVAAVALVIAIATPATATLHLHQPQQLPFSDQVGVFTELGLAAQNTYCGHYWNQAGRTFEDYQVLDTIGDGKGIQRVTILYSNALGGIVVAAQGTNTSVFSSKFRTINDLWLPAWETGIHTFGAAVQAGFYWQWRRVWHDVRKSIQYHRGRFHNVSRLYVTGHGQGAGYGVLLAASLERAFPRAIAKVVMFGIVRPGNKEFSDSFSSIFHNRYAGVTNGRDWFYDLVPVTIPWSYYLEPNVPVILSELILGFNYKHVGPVVLIHPGNSSEYYTFKNPEDSALNLHRQFTPFKHNLIFDGLNWGDHDGWYMNVRIGGNLKWPCPARKGGPTDPWFQEQADKHHHYHRDH